MVLIGHHQISHLEQHSSVLSRIEFALRLIMNSFAGTGQKRCIDLGRFFREGCAIAATELFFQFSDSREKFLDEIMTVIKVAGRSLELALGGDFGTSNSRVDLTIFYSKAPPTIPELRAKELIISDFSNCLISAVMFQ